MSKPFYLDIRGIKEIQDKLIKAGARAKSEVREELKDGAQVIARNAQRDAPKNYGRLQNSIKSVTVKELEYDIVSPVSYSPYVEWGTKKKAKVPSNLTAYAAQFKGLKTGSAEEALYAITAWVKKKGIRIDSAATFKSGKRKGSNKQLTAEQTAYIIFHFIMLNGMKAHPYFFKNYEAQEPIILKNITTVLGDIL